MQDDNGRLLINSYKPLREIVFEHLRNAILNGDLEPGQRLMELHLAEQLGVSRTPIREAIRKLELEGLVSMIPRKGAYVGEVSIKDILDVLEVRMSLEGLAAALSAERMHKDQLEQLGEVLKEFEMHKDGSDKETMAVLDRKFHELIINGSNNNKLIQLIQGIHEQFQRFRIIYFNEYTQYEELVQHHREIYNAIADRDSKSAQIASENHIKMIQRYIILWKNKNLK